MEENRKKDGTDEKYVNGRLIQDNIRTGTQAVILTVESQLFFQHLLH
jgi:hypothetical protein